MARTGAELVIETLVAAGVEHLFTVSGNQILSLYDATIGRGIALIHARHEAAAVHMADAWGRLTDRPGVALVTAGPGHRNALSALYGARMAETPVVLLSGHSPRSQMGAGAFQEVDQVAAARPVTKAAWLVEDPERLGAEVATALALAASGRPGPVHLSLPGDVLEAAVSSPRAAPTPEAIPPSPPLGDGPIREVLTLLAGARRPLILTGPAMARGERAALVARLSEVTGAPVLPIESPRGVNDPWLHGATGCLAEADLVLLLGKALDFSLGFGEGPAFSGRCRFVQITADARLTAERVALAICGDPSVAAAQLAAAAREREWRPSSWRAAVSASRAATPSAWEELRHSSREPLHPLRVCAALQPLLDAGALLVSDGGEFGQWAQAALETETRLINGLSGSIGSGIPMAIGARLARPGLPVVVTLGDGTFGYHALELDTALRYRLPVVVVVGNDARWNAEYQLQVRHYGAARAVGCDLLPARYDRVAAALGGHGEFVERSEELGGALARAMASGLPACVNVLIENAAAPTFRAGGHAH
ncbi:MAG: thiamine pyrophosphate-binding protein [Candidatus Rokubacteria bacterium]|nr:thiamine pyrophosphate-binding protein [Candidatus Rokubacteria bacterium]